MIDVLVIGSGPAGCSAAIYSVRANLKTVMFHGNEPGGQLTTTTDIENYPGFTAIGGIDLMLKMEEHAKAYGTEIYNGEVKEIVKKDGFFEVKTSSKKMPYLETKTIILCTGASAKWLGLESETKFKAAGVTACAVCDGPFYKSQDVAVVGGGNTAVTEALYLSGICKKVYLIHRRDEFRAEKVLIDRLKSTSNIELVLDSATNEIKGEESPRKKVNAIEVKNLKSGKLTDISVTGIFIAIGHKPNTKLVQGLTELDEEGYVVVEKGTTLTKCAGLFAAGDVQDKVYKQAITSAGTGCMAALDAADYISRL